MEAFARALKAVFASSIFTLDHPTHRYKRLIDWSQQHDARRRPRQKHKCVHIFSLRSFDIKRSPNRPADGIPPDDPIPHELIQRR
jgi:hypothetical protein